MNDFVVSFQDVKRQFGKVDAVNGVTFSVKQGSVFGLLGTNGAGKTTAIRMLVGHLMTDSGCIEVFGSDPRSHSAQTLQRVAYVSDQMQLPGRMPLAEVFALNEQFFAKWDHALALQLVNRFGINPSSRYCDLSLGQKRRAVLVQAVCQGAELLVLDEPFSGLDVKIRRQCLDLLLEAAVDRGQTIVVSSHLLNDVERIVDTVAILDAGRLVLTGDLEQLKSDLRRVRIGRAAEDAGVQQLLQRCDV
ncbi:MAG: ABC transporter ATP-binding protein, partial [Fuerstiella sp.]